MSRSPGRFNRRIDILREVRTRDGSGYITTWPARFSRVPAEVLNLSGRESVIGQALQSIKVFRITIRWRPGVLETDQVVYNGLTLNIRSADDPDGSREDLVIVAETGTSVPVA